MNSAAEMWPTFVVIGAAKAGTTSLASYLGEHPDVFITDPKEPGHFTGTGAFADRQAYLGLFAASSGQSVRGEASTTYSRKEAFPGVAARMYRMVPDVKLIYMLRDPMERLRSHYLMRLRNGTSEGTFEEFVTRNDWYTGISCYASQLEPYLELFPLEQIHFVWLHEMASDPAGTLSGVARHIGASAGFYSAEREYRTANAAPSESLRHLRVPTMARRVLDPISPRLRRRIKQSLPKVALDRKDLELSRGTAELLEQRFAADHSILQQILARGG